MAKHTITDWCDFVRGVADERRAAELDEALASAPAGTRRTVSLLARVAEVGRKDAEMEIPENAVRMAKALGSLRRPTAEKAGRFRLLPFSVSFDSWLQPSLAGTRTLASDHRQLVCESEDLTVELRLEQGEDGGAVVLLGQVLRTGGEPAPLGGRPVVVYAGDEAVAQTTTSDFGELQIQDLPAGPLELALQVSDDSVLRIPLETSGADG